MMQGDALHDLAYDGPESQESNSFPGFPEIGGDRFSSNTAQDDESSHKPASFLQLIAEATACNPKARVS